MKIREIILWELGFLLDLGLDFRIFGKADIIL
jgi:hypothetical protein